MPKTHVADELAEAQKPETKLNMAKHSEQLDGTLTLFRMEIAEDRFASATGKFREAINLSRAWPELQARVIRASVEQAKILLPRNWRVAEVLLDETKGLGSNYSVPAELMDRVRAAQKDETISMALHAVDRTEVGSSLDKAREQVQGLLVTYPGNDRLLERLQQIDARMKPETAATDKPVPIGPALKFEQVKPDAVETPIEGTEDPADDSARLKIAISSGSLDRLKTALTIFGSVAMILAATTLIWMHYRHPATLIKIIKPPQQAIAPSTPDELAWKTIESSEKPDDMKLFLRAYPASRHAVRAKVKLSAMEWQAVDRTSALSLRAYLVHNANAIHAAEARKLLREVTEADEWDSLDHTDPKALQAFLVAHPHEANAKAAQQELAALQAKTKNRP